MYSISFDSRPVSHNYYTYANDLAAATVRVQILHDTRGQWIIKILSSNIIIWVVAQGKCKYCEEETKKVICPQI